MDGLAEHDEIDYIPSERKMGDDVAQETHPSQSHRVTVEDSTPERYAEDYDVAEVAHILRKSQTTFEAYKEYRHGLGEGPWAPFDDEKDWQLARFLIKEVSQTTADKFLKLPIVSGPRVLIVCNLTNKSLDKPCHITCGIRLKIVLNPVSQAATSS
jgi:hypothetical protein